MSSSTLTISAHCHCRRANFTYSIPSTLSPLKSAVCQCNSCRYSTGQLFGTFVVIPSPKTFDTSTLTEYKSSVALSRYFCPSCGASVGNIEPHEWEFATGLFTAETRKTLNLNRTQLWVSDTRDGGCTAWLDAATGGGSIKAKGRESEDVSLEQVKEMKRQSLRSGSSAGNDNGERLEGGCKCGKVQFYVTKPEDGNGDGRYEALFCPCTSCRLTTGFEITAWVRVPRSSLFYLDGKALDLSEAVEGLKRYKSSPGVERFFCERCGATAIYRAREETIDIAAGVLKSKSGVLTEPWLDWNRTVKYMEDAIDPGFVEGFVKALGEV